MLTAKATCPPARDAYSTIGLPAWEDVVASTPKTRMTATEADVVKSDSTDPQYVVKSPGRGVMNRISASGKRDVRRVFLPKSARIAPAVKKGIVKER